MTMTMQSIRAAALPLLLVVVSGFAMPAAHAQMVYRCGSTYTHTPCPEGRVVAATDPRSAAQRAEAQRIAALESQRASQMEHERLTQEAAQKPAMATGFDSRASATAAKAPSTEHGRHQKKKKHKAGKQGEGDDFVAVDPTTLKKRSRK
ncbi:MAG TPA: hypothetical protein VIO33_25725 [Burkholderiaceae bacterium]